MEMGVKVPQNTMNYLQFCQIQFDVVRQIKYYVS